MPSLQDQLLKTKLVDEKKAKQLDKERRKQKKQARQTGEDLGEEVRVSAQEARREKAERDRSLNQKREDAARERAVAAQIRQLIDQHRQPKSRPDAAELEYHFTDGRTIKKLLVSAEVQQQIIRGQLVIVRRGAKDESYELVPRVVSDKIAQRDETLIVVANQKADSGVDEDDPYKDYVIPDDLMW